MSSDDPLFLDTGGLVALLAADDALHAEASRRFAHARERGQPLLTTDWVLAELGNGLARTPARMLGVELIRALLAEPRTHVVFVDKPLLIRALGRYAGYLDKTWGLVDCVSFEVMLDYNARDAFTPDRHFEQAGFHRLL